MERCSIHKSCCLKSTAPQSRNNCTMAQSVATLEEKGHSHVSRPGTTGTMRDDVTLWCRTCTSCAAKARPKKTPQAAMGTVRVGAPFERIAVDLMGPLNETERRNRYILVVQDYFSKWVEAYPVPNEQATTVAEKIVSEWVCRYGAPQCLHSDQGTNFESAVFQSVRTAGNLQDTDNTVSAADRRPSRTFQCHPVENHSHHCRTMSLGLGHYDPICSQGLPCIQTQLHEPDA